jgi:hypothetical protein
MWRPITAADFNGDGHGDILWRFDNGHLSLWNMFGGRNTGYTENPTSPQWFSGWGIPMPADLNGDLVDDILWKGADGPTTVPLTERWTMHGSAVPTEISTSRDPSWIVAGAGKFSFSAGDTAGLFWVSMDGFSTRFEVSGAPPYDGPAVHPDWQVKGVADFNADGMDDILWRHRVSGDISIWPIMWGWPSAQPIVGNRPTSWRIVGAGDIDGDNIAEIIWRNTTGSISITQFNANLTPTHGPTTTLGSDYVFAGLLRAPGKFGHLYFKVTKQQPMSETCKNFVFTFTGTHGSPFTRTVVPKVGTLGDNRSCTYEFELVDLQDTYTVTYPGGCKKVTIMGFEAVRVLESSPQDLCTPMTPPPPTTPPPPPQQVTSTAVMNIWGGGPASSTGNIWYGGTFPAAPTITGSVVSITNPNNFVLGFPTRGNTTNDCNDASKIAWVDRFAAMSSAQIDSIYGATQPRLPITLVACIATLPAPMTVLMQVTHVGP